MVTEVKPGITLRPVGGVTKVTAASRVNPVVRQPLPWGTALMKGRLFEACVQRSFDAVDIGHDGRISKQELSLGILRLYDFLNSKLPCHLVAPPNEEIFKLLDKYDRTGTGSLDFPSYYELCRGIIFNPQRWRDSVVVKVGYVVLTRVVAYPWMANVLKTVLLAFGIKTASYLPLPAIALAVEMAIKQLAPPGALPI